jgi:hypothetical protein
MKPLIFTTKGNLELDTLTHKVEWRQSSEQIVFIETYKLNGEIVKESSHVCILTGVAPIGDCGQI